MNSFYYVYILVSETNEKLHYGGVTRDLNAWLSEHNRGDPGRFRLQVAFRSEAKARRFERYLKTGSGREFARRHF